MKRFLRFLLTISLFFTLNSPAFASEYYSLTGSAGTMRFTVGNVSRASSNIEISDNTTESNYVTITSDNDISLNFNLSNDLYFERASNLPTEKEIIMIKNSNDELVGLVGIPVVSYEDGTTEYGVNTINGNAIISSENDSEKVVDSISTRAYIQRDFYYYFSAGNYGTREYSENYIDSNGNHIEWTAVLGNFWMRPIQSAFNLDELRYLEVQLMSWDAVDNYFRGFSGSDYTKWVNNNNNLKKQYDCHFNYCPRNQEWNLEEWRTNATYEEMVINLCNVKSPLPNS